MDSFDAIVVGSGPAAAFAAVGLRGRHVLMLDVGFDAATNIDLRGNLYDLRQAHDDLFDPLIGRAFESLHNLHQPPISLKLKSPFMSYIARDARRLTPIAGDSFGGVVSLARGGLANAWGAGVFRYTDRDLAGFPIAAADLRSCFDEVTARIGVSGVNGDDLEPHFERDDQLQPPIRLSSIFDDMLRRYERSKAAFKGARVALGRSRLAVLTQPRDGRAPYEYENLEFFRPHDPGIYTPAYTVDELIASGDIDYCSRRLALRYAERNGAVEVEARNLDSGDIETWRARALCLAAGALNTTRIVLASNNDHQTRLPLLDNPMACIPLLDLTRIGGALQTRDTSLAQLNVVAEDDDGRLAQGSLYGTSGPLRSDFLFELPLSARGNRVWAKYVAPATAFLMLFYARDPVRGRPDSGVRLRTSGELDVRFAPEPPHALEDTLIGLFRRIGFLSHRAMIQRPPMGSALHFAATLPMTAEPSRYETDRYGRLAGTSAVHIVDGACLSRLPAKNATLTIMANALRIGRRLATTLA
jgi:choline dehydrogenase-like flavoprotein